MLLVVCVFVCGAVGCGVVAVGVLFFEMVVCWPGVCVSCGAVKAVVAAALLMVCCVACRYGSGGWFLPCKVMCGAGGLGVVWPRARDVLVSVVAVG